jgi:hypothetical protein
MLFLCVCVWCVCVCVCVCVLYGNKTAVGRLYDNMVKDKEHITIICPHVYAWSDRLRLIVDWSSA